MKELKNVSLILVLILLALECKKESGPADAGSNTGPLTEQEKQAIIQTHQSIAVSADTILLGGNPIAGFQRMLSSYRAYPNVEDAWTDAHALYVSYKKAGLVQWYVAPEVTTPPYDRVVVPPAETPLSLARSSAITNTRVCLINTMDQDESRTVYREYFAFLKRKFEESGFQVTTVNGAAANVQFFRTGLRQFGVVVFFAHGKHDDRKGRTWLQTGEVGSVQGLLSNYLNEIQSGQMDMFDVQETRGGQKVATPYYAVSDSFIRASYASGDFPGSFIYLGACQGLKSPNTRPLGQAFAAKGASAVIGWTETNSVGPSTARRLFGFLLCGKKLQDAYRALPREDKSDTYASAILTYFPPEADEARLVTNEQKATLNIIRPKKDSTYTTRTIVLAGNLINGDSISLGTVELNLVALPLGLLSDRKTFSQQVGIKSGTNTIRMTGFVRVPSGCACVDTNYTFQGNFSPLDLWTELRWNTDNSDVDFHLLPPGASFPGSFWTTTDCYYGNRTPSWGGSLDIDDVNGRGPEHITIPTVTAQGEYRLFVHYYASHGAPPTSAYVSVSVRNGPNEEFSPMALSRSAGRGGDIWEVCKITYPAGSITRVMSKTTLPGSGAEMSIARGMKK